MGKPFHDLLRRTLYRDRANLISLDDPWVMMPRLLAGVEVRGIVDAGASDGRVSRRLLERFPAATMYAFEPQPRYVDALQQYARDEPRFKPQMLALGDAPGELELHLTAAAGQTSLFRPNAQAGTYDAAGSAVAQVVRIPAVRLDDWAAEHAVARIEVIKLDIQQAELLALRGASKLLATSVRLVYTEVFFNPLYEGGALFGDVDALLRQSGFVLHDFYKPNHDAAGRLLWANAIFVRQ